MIHVISIHDARHLNIILVIAPPLPPPAHTSHPYPCTTHTIPMHTADDGDEVLSFTHSNTHSLAHSVKHTVTHPLTHSLTHPFTHQLTHSPTHSAGDDSGEAAETVSKGLKLKDNDGGQSNEEIHDKDEDEFYSDRYI